MQKLDFKQKYTKQKIEQMLEELEQKQIITTKQKQSVPKKKILAFTQSELFKDISKSVKVCKEQPFYINIPVKELYESTSDEKILVQGIIDLYYITENNEIVLVDYKTDYVPEKQEQNLIEKYQGQLSLYKRALEQSLQRKISKIYIYSTYLEKAIKL